MANNIDIVFIPTDKVSAVYPMIIREVQMIKLMVLLLILIKYGGIQKLVENIGFKFII